MGQTVRSKLIEMESTLIKAPRRRMFASNKWVADFPREPGVYAIWDIISRKPVYVGESSALKARMSDIKRRVNHTFRKKAAKVLNINPENEEVLTAKMSKHYEVSFIEVDLGRAELEEYLVLRWRDSLLNKPAKRLLRGERYKWVDPGYPKLVPLRTNRSTHKGF